MTHTLRTSASRPGMVLLEVVVSLGLIVIFAIAFAELTLGFPSSSRVGGGQIVAAHFAEEGLEATRSIADQNFSNLVNGVHGITSAAGTYGFTGSSDAMGDYVRTVTVAGVNRDGNGNIVQSGGTSDARTKSVISAVTWTPGEGTPLTVTLTTYLTQWSHLLWFMDTATDFNAGYRNGTTVTQTGNGEVQMEKQGDMSRATLWTTLNVPGGAAVTDAHIDTATDRLYITKAQNGNNPEFVSFDIANMTAKSAPVMGSTDIGTDARRFALGSQYAYIATSDLFDDIRVIRLSDMHQVSTWDLFTFTTPSDITVDDAAHRAYVTTNISPILTEFFVLDISNPLASSPNVLSTAWLWGGVTSVSVSGNYAYLGSSNSSGELAIVDLTNTDNVVQCDLPGSEAVNDIRVNGTRLFVGRAAGSDPEFVEYAIDPSHPTDCSYILSHVTGHVDASSDVLALDVNITMGRAFLAVNGSPQIVVVNLSTYAKSTVSLQGNQPCNAIAVLGPYIYAGCQESGKVQIARGLLTGSSDPYSLWSTYTSPAFDSSKTTTVWGSISWVSTGAVSFRLRSADTQANLDTALWTGPDGTFSTTYTQSSGQAIVPNPGATGKRWMQWKAYFSGDGTTTSILDNVSLSYQ